MSSVCSYDDERSHLITYLIGHESITAFEAKVHGNCAVMPTENGHATAGPSPAKPAKSGKSAVDVSIPAIDFPVALHTIVKAGALCSAPAMDRA